MGQVQLLTPVPVRTLFFLLLACEDSDRSGGGGTEPRKCSESSDCDAIRSNIRAAARWARNLCFSSPMHLAGVREGGGGGGLLGSAARRQGRRQPGTAVRYPVGQGRTRGARQPLELVLWTEAADPVAEAAGDEEGRRGRRGPSVTSHLPVAGATPNTPHGACLAKGEAAA
ncbi:hypothetical protein PVAP13_1KG073277 [Panicum virgatum]|uniref:Uncharacterized protein n=1 Tax=Panicum virgatum TaxID=38727 RepID=A0A8T0XEI8_PANVG|nr:hypothetical protein PVAP13_1KG073277 [Panicum virgatum]